MKSKSTSTLGQFKDEVVGEAKKQASDTGKGLVQEPKKILESILGKPTNKKDGKDKDDSGVEELVRGASDPKQAALQQQKQQLLAKKKMDDQKKRQQLLRLHRQRLEEEKAFFNQQEKKKEQEEEMEEQQEDQGGKSEIVQLQREKQKSEQLQRQTQGVQGSKEFGKGKKY